MIYQEYITNILDTGRLLRVHCLAPQLTACAQTAVTYSPSGNGNGHGSAQPSGCLIRYSQFCRLIPWQLPLACLMRSQFTSPDALIALSRKGGRGGCVRFPFFENYFLENNIYIYPLNKRTPGKGGKPKRPMICFQSTVTNRKRICKPAKV